MIPEGLPQEKDKVFKLKRGLYGLRESPKCWNRKFNIILEKYFKL